MQRRVYWNMRKVKLPYRDRHLVGFICVGEVFHDEYPIGYLLRKGKEFRIIGISTLQLVLREEIAMNETETTYCELWGTDYIKKDIYGRWTLVKGKKSAKSAL